RRRAGHGARGAAGMSVERLHREDGAVASRLLPAVFHRRYRVDGVFRSAYTTPRRRRDRDLPRLVGDARRVRREQLRLRRDRHLDQGRSLRLVVAALLVLASCRSSRGERSAAAGPGGPGGRGGPAWLRERGAAEAVLAARSATVHDFQFTDRRETSGITFVNRIVDDAGKAYKKVHYDHGRPDLYFVTQLGRNELWKNVGDGRFADITDQAGVAMPDDVSVAAAFADIDNDGDPDLFVTTVRHGNRLFENIGGGRFRDI